MRKLGLRPSNCPEKEYINGIFVTVRFKLHWPPILISQCQRVDSLCVAVNDNVDKVNKIPAGSLYAAFSDSATLNKQQATP